MRIPISINTFECEYLVVAFESVFDVCVQTVVFVFWIRSTKL